MKTCIVSFGNFMVVPYISTYIDILDKADEKYDIIYWNRSGIEEKGYNCEILYEYKKKLEETKNLFKKFAPIIGFARFAKKILSKNNYGRVVILSSLPGVLLERFLVKKVKGRYIFDIRDYSYENIAWYYKKMESLMKNSALNVISSPGFMNFLPKEKCSLIHNCAYPDCGKETFEKKEGTLSIAFIGVVRFADECKQFLNKIKNDKRVVFEFFGEGVGEKVLKDYCSENGFENVNFHGRYMPEEKSDIIRGADFIFNAYGNKKISLIYALSNKYYDALYFKKPLIVNENTTMAEFSEGISFNVHYNSQTFVDDLINWYNGINEEFINQASEKYLQKAIEENEEVSKKISIVLTENN